jgi:hypothetical protein
MMTPVSTENGSEKRRIAHTIDHALDARVEEENGLLFRGSLA